MRLLSSRVVRWLLLPASLIALDVSCSDRSTDCSVLLDCTAAGTAGASSGEQGSGGAISSPASGGTSSAEGGSESMAEAGAAMGGAAGADAGAGGASAGGSAGSAAESGEGGAAGVGGAPSTCDETLAPSEAPCIVDEAHAVFVAPTGADSADGSRDAPLLTLAKAIEVAASANKFVIACNGTYEDALVIKSAVQIYGGFACPGDTETAWTYVPGAVARVAPAKKGVALSISAAEDAVLIEDFEFRALDATSAGESSIAAIVESSETVALRRVRIAAGNGAKGKDGEDGAKGEDGAMVGPAQKGVGASCGASAPEEQSGGEWPGDASSCRSVGGKGGTANEGNDGSAGLPGNPRENVLEPDLDNGGPKGSVGGDGQPGSPGLPGGSGTAITVDPSASFTALGYTLPSPGGNGEDGFTGQGGGGGGASNAKASCIGASGGAGGMGGCPGKGGTGGGAGGASVALLVWSSDVVLDGCELVAGRGGDGGNGGNGGDGGTGSNGASGGEEDATNAIGKGGNGGKGGDGGAGGPGAGGNGGPSVALVVHGTAPAERNDTVLAPGTAGARGLGGNANHDADGGAGIAAQQLTVP